MKLDRRNILSLGFSLTATKMMGCSTLGAYAQSFRASLPENAEENQLGDPDLNPELLLWNEDIVDIATSPLEAIGIEKVGRDVAIEMVKVAQSFVGRSRDSHPEFIEEMFNIMRIEPRYNGRLKPFCAAGVAYCATLAYCNVAPAEEISAASRPRVLSTVLSDINKFYFLPHASVQSMVNGSIKRKSFIEKADIDPKNLNEGWLVVYNWNLDQKADHVGIIKLYGTDGLHTIEFNTSNGKSGSQRNGGVVAERLRTLDNVVGYIRTY